MVLITALVGSASAFAAPPQPKFTATPLTPSDQTTLAAAKAPAAVPQNAARAAGATSLAATSGKKLVGVIVKLDVDALASYRGGVPGLDATSPSVTGATKLDAQSAASQKYLAYVNAQQDSFIATAKRAIPSANITQKLDVVVGGVSMLLPGDQVESLSKLPGVLAVYPDELLHLDTDRTPAFIGATTIWQKLGGQESAGDNVIVGVLDSGIWPEHPSFSDPDPSGKPYGPKPAKWKGTRCDFGIANPFFPSNVDPAFTCNNKLIGARRFMTTYTALVGLEAGEFFSARDDDGHGTHTASTAAGNANVAASIFGVSRGTISGIAPRARVSAYKVCGAQGCFGSDSAAAVQRAILDGVDVINFSISGGANPYSDAVELAFLDAYNAGVFVAASAGNSGPGPDTTDHRGPWVTTVAASTADRAFKNTITVTGGGASLTLEGVSLTAGVGPKALVVNPDPLCASAAAPGTFTDQIVICRRGNPVGRVADGFNVLQGGAAGMILYNSSAASTDQETDNHFLPASHIQFSQGQQLLAFLAAHPGATATLTAGIKSTQQGDVMASFSSRGGPNQSLGISKPDITAPGVQILAGHTPKSVDIATGPQGELFQAIAGTSMSSPHIAGSGALIKALHPDWTPGQIKSALMTTAKTKVVKEDGVTPADAFDHGSGRADLTVAGDPGLTFDVTKADYLAHQSDLWAVNYPSVYFPVMPGVTTVQRTAHSVVSKRTHWELKVTAPKDVKIKVPEEINVPAGGDASFSITVDARDVPIGQTRFATITLKEDDAFGKRVLHMPVTLVRKQPAVTLDTSCDPASIKRGATTSCMVTASNTTFSDANVSISDSLPKQLELVPGSVVGGAAGRNRVSFSGTLAGAQAPLVAVAATPVGTTPSGGFLPLGDFGITPIAGVGDETITNFNVPGFTYAGQVYTRIAIDSNGYVVVGGGTGADNDCCANQNLPDPTRPNNIIAPFWTDLNPGAGGSVRIGTLTDGSNDWLIVEFENVPEFSTAANTHSFQIWLGLAEDASADEDVTIVYGANTGNGDGGFATAGAENFAGTSGTAFYFNGAGTLPVDGTALRVSGTPGVPGETKTITFKATGKSVGGYVNYAEMTGDIFFGTNVARFAGAVTR